MTLRDLHKTLDCSHNHSDGCCDCNRSLRDTAHHATAHNQFPAAEGVDIQLSREAVQFYKSGRPFLHNFLPFWMSELFGKLIILLIPILGVLYPMIRFLPLLYDWLMRSKILRIYGELRFLEDVIIDARRAGRDLSPMVAQLDQLEG